MRPPLARPPAALGGAVLAALFALGCALTSKSEATAPRYFSPERPAELSRAPSPAPGAGAELRLGRVTSASHLDERLVFRDSDQELGYYQERRWTEAPEQYLKRRLGRVLFEERGLRRVVGGQAPTLELELIAFEEIRVAQIARVQVIVRLQDQRVVRWEETLTVDQPVAQSAADNRAAAMVEALGQALRALVDRIAERVVSELSAPAASPGEARARRP